MLRQLERSFERDLKSAEVAIVDADDVAAGRDRDIQFAAVVDFDQRGHAVPRRQLAEIANLALGQDRGDQQDGIRAVRRGLQNVDRGDREILAQHREGDRRRGRSGDRRRLPWKKLSSVSTETAAAPPRS